MGRKTSFWIVSITLAGVFAPHCARANIVCDHSQTPASFFNARASLDGAEPLDDVTEIQLMAYITQRTTADSLINRGYISFYDESNAQDPSDGWLTVYFDGVLVPDGDHPTCTDVMTLLGSHGTCECIAGPSDPPGRCSFSLSCTDASAAALNAAIQPSLSSSSDILMLTIAAATSLMSVTVIVVAVVWFCDRSRQRRREPIYDDGASKEALLQGVN